MRRDPDPVRFYMTLTDALFLGIGLGLGFLVVWSAVMIGIALGVAVVVRSQT